MYPYVAVLTEILHKQGISCDAPHGASIAFKIAYSGHNLWTVLFTGKRGFDCYIIHPFCFKANDGKLIIPYLEILNSNLKVGEIDYSKDINMLSYMGNFTIPETDDISADLESICDYFLNEIPLYMSEIVQQYEPRMPKR